MCFLDIRSEADFPEAEKVEPEVIAEEPVEEVIETAKKTLYTGHIGDGKIFVYDVENVVKVRTGEEGYDALQKQKKQKFLDKKYKEKFEKVRQNINKD